MAQHIWSIKNQPKCVGLITQALMLEPFFKKKIDNTSSEMAKNVSLTGFILTVSGGRILPSFLDTKSHFQAFYFPLKTPRTHHHKSSINSYLTLKQHLIS
jgi:hypothetical protein